MLLLCHRIGLSLLTGDPFWFLLPARVLLDDNLMEFYWTYSFTFD